MNISDSSTRLAESKINYCRRSYGKISTWKPKQLIRALCSTLLKLKTPLVDNYVDRFNVVVGRLESILKTKREDESELTTIYYYLIQLEINLF